MEKECYGIFSRISQKFVFNINEPSRHLAWEKLKQRLGADVCSWRFYVRPLQQGE
jgi:hypothetical protein